MRHGYCSDRRVAPAECVVVACLLALSVGSDTAHAATSVTVRVTIDKISAIDCFEGEFLGGCTGAADFYSIVTIDGRTISSVSDLNAAMASTHSGDKITVGWQDSAGQSHDATVTLTTGAA